MTADSLHRAVDQLLRRPSLRIQLTPDQAYTVHAPCLLAQLADAAGASTTGTGGGTVPGSRAPANPDALDLWAEIVYDLSAWSVAVGVDRRRYLRPAEFRPTVDRPPAWMTRLSDWVQPVAWDEPIESPVKPEHPVAATPAPASPAGPGPRHQPTRSSELLPAGRLLRAVAAAVSSRIDHAKIAGRIEANCWRWAGQIRAMLTPTETTRGLAGVPCEHCGARWVTDPDRPDDPDAPRLPAVWVEYGETGIIRCLWCRACDGHVWRDELVRRAGAA